MKKPILSFVGHPNLILDALHNLAKQNKLHFASNPENFHKISEWDDAQCILESKEFRCRFAVQQMPGCCAVLILHHVAPEPYSRETFDHVLGLIEQATYDAGFGSLMMAQTVGRNGAKAELWANCEANGWTLSDPFMNAKSGNQVVYLTKNLMQPGKRDGLEIEIK